MKQIEPARVMARLPQDIRRWLEQQATQNFSSMNSEIVRSIRARMAAEAEQQSGAVG